MSWENKNGEVHQCDSLLTSGFWLKKMWNIHWKQFVTLLIEQIQSKHNKNMIILCHNNTVNFFCPPGTSDLTKQITKKGLWVKWGGPAFFPHWVWYDHTKSKPNLYICKNWGFGFSSVPGGRILPILQECPLRSVIKLFKLGRLEWKVQRPFLLWRSTAKRYSSKTWRWKKWLGQEAGIC